MNEETRVCVCVWLWEVCVWGLWEGCGWVGVAVVSVCGCWGALGGVYGAVLSDNNISFYMHS